MLLGVAEIQSINHQANVCRILADIPTHRNINHLYGVFVKSVLAFGKQIPVGIGSLVNDTSLFEETFQYRSNFKRLASGLFKTNGYVIVVDK
ncbi:hypothetical protein BMS3Bbin04_00790 [bacterium BMS3Bbin04]|nr:hypothetical protein BMS3Bbin04_00790 [bacterium BMS3Bbin04]